VAAIEYLAEPELSVVAPMYDEEEVLPAFLGRLRPVLDGLRVRYEVIAVDDASADQTPVVLQRARRSWPQLRLLRLRANAGHQAALSAGLSRARGRWVVTIDADLQDPPELIADLLAEARTGEVDVVYGVRSNRSSDSAFKRRTAGLYYRLLRRLSGVDAPRDAGDFRLMSRATVDAVLAVAERGRVLRVVVPALGFPSAIVRYRREHRAAGRSKYPLSKMVGLALESVINWSLAPLRMATWFGLLGFLAALLSTAYGVVGGLLGHAVPGWTSTVTIVSAFAAVELLCIGVLGEYVGRMLKAQQALPAFFVAYDSAETSHARRVS